MRHSFDYAVLRVVPRVERGEFINAGVVVFCLEQKFLQARIQVDEARLGALWSGLDCGQIRDHLGGILRICDGDRAAGPIALLSQRERFHWLVSPRSTVIQVSPVHSGICESPSQTLDELFELMVLRRAADDVRR
jgi:hypothetical protein